MVRASFYQYNNLKKNESLCTALRENDLDVVRFLSSVQQVYDNYPKKHALSLAIELKDLEGVQYVSAKYNLNYLQILYPLPITDLGQYIRKAVELLDLKGIQYISLNYGIDYKPFLYALPDRLLLAVFFKDTDGIDYLVSTYGKNIKKTTELAEAYYKQDFVVTEKLITDVGMEFLPSYLLHTTLLHIKKEYLQHLQNIEKQIGPNRYTEALSVVDSLFTSSSFNQTAMFLSCDVLRQNVYSDSLNTAVAFYNECKLYTHYHYSVKDIFLVSASDLAQAKIIIPSTNLKDAYFRHPDLKAPYLTPYIFVSTDKYQDSVLVHEQGHFLFDILFDNGANVYTKEDEQFKTPRYTDYCEAAKDALINIATFLGHKQAAVPLNYEDIALFLQGDVNLLLINWYILHNNEGAVSVPQPVLEQLASSLCNAYNISPTITSYDKQSRLFTKIVIKKGWSDDEMYVLYRMFDYVHRGKDGYGAELLNRIPEFYVKGIDSTLIEKFFSPLIKFWEEHISPLVKAKLHSFHILTGHYIYDFVEETDSKHIVNNPEDFCKSAEKIIKLQLQEEIKIKGNLSYCLDNDLLSDTQMRDLLLTLDSHKDQDLYSLDKVIPRLCVDSICKGQEELPICKESLRESFLVAGGCMGVFLRDNSISISNYVCASKLVGGIDVIDDEL
jgi:hypothetical protein